jgi:RimJ/RimL family protein N-acetyltransferase
MSERRFRIEWQGATDVLAAIEPTAGEVRAHARALAGAYNDEHNRAMMGHERMTEGDVIAYFADMARDGARVFLLFRDGALAGDGDLRGIADGAAELAIMIGTRDAQGKGLGTRFATMLHAFAFRLLDLHKVYVAIVSANAASRRLFEKLGYRVDDSHAARAYADEDTDVTMSVDRSTFESTHAAALDQIAIAAR